MQKISAFSSQVFLVFGLLGVLFIPFTFRYIPFQESITHFLFEDFLVFIASKFEGIYIANPEVSSDSTTLYLLFGVLFTIALLVVIGLSFSSFWQKHRKKVQLAIRLILTYYLSLILLKYGFDKVFKAQFYLPEPNTLYTPMGMLDKDILFWSTMGVSRSYNIFMGCIEIIPALLLLHSKTRILGLFILFGVLLNVVFINLGFDISVKLFSLFLLFLTIILLAPSISRIIRFFIVQKSAQLERFTGAQLIPSKVIRRSLKGVVLLFFAAEALFPYIQSGHYNDDLTPRNYLHGAYEVMEIVSDKEGQNLPEIKRIFIHRQNYFIMQFSDDTMEDFKLKIDPSQKELILTTYDEEIVVFQYDYNEAQKELSLLSKSLGWNIVTKELDWQKLPALQPLFHWTVDGVF